MEEQATERGVAGVRPGLAQAGEAPERSGPTVAYDPAAKFELEVSEVEFPRTSSKRRLMARIYQPQGPGPFPTVLDLHGGAWRQKDRLAEEPMDRAIAASGVLVVAIDLRLSTEAPYPASVQDANYGVRWLKARAADWNGDPSRIGVYGSAGTDDAAFADLGDTLALARYPNVAIKMSGAPSYSSQPYPYRKASSACSR
jgi:acetyl esterase/lipase